MRNKIKNNNNGIKKTQNKKKALLEWNKKIHVWKGDRECLFKPISASTFIYLFIIFHIIEFSLFLQSIFQSK